MPTTAKRLTQYPGGRRVHTLVLVLAAACSLAVVPTFPVCAQEASPDIEPGEYQIIGVDTRVFAITGDRASTVTLRSFPVTLPPDERRVETSEGLIDNDNRLWKTGDVTNADGVYASGGLTIGSRTPFDGFAAASLDGGSRAGTVGFSHRTADENTPANLAPSSLEAGGTFYAGRTDIRARVEAAYDRDDDAGIGETLRRSDRETSGFRTDAVARMPFGDTGEGMGRLRLRTRRYRDGIAGYSMDELSVAGGVSLTGDVGAMTLIARSDVDYTDFEGDSGSIVSAGVKAETLLWGDMTLHAGATVVAYAMPNDDTELRLYPDLMFHWAVGRSVYLRAAFTPDVRRHSASGLYDLNGLVMPAPLLYEDRSIDLSGEFGWRIGTATTLTLGGFHTKTDNALVFSRAGNLFALVGSAEVERTGARMGGTWRSGDRMGLDADVTYATTSWNYSGDVPYAPELCGTLDAYISPADRWTLRAGMALHGDHAVERGSTDTVDSFMTIDCGVERELTRNMGLAFTIRNLTNAEGAWWTDRYQIPGVGMYAALNAHY